MLVTTMMPLQHMRGGDGHTTGTSTPFVVVPLPNLHKKRFSREKKMRLRRSRSAPSSGLNLTKPKRQHRPNEDELRRHSEHHHRKDKQLVEQANAAQPALIVADTDTRVVPSPCNSQSSLCRDRWGSSQTTKQGKNHQNHPRSTNNTPNCDHSPHHPEPSVSLNSTDALVVWQQQNSSSANRMEDDPCSNHSTSSHSSCPEERFRDAAQTKDSCIRPPRRQRSMDQATHNHKLRDACTQGCPAFVATTTRSSSSSSRRGGRRQRQAAKLATTKKEADQEDDDDDSFASS